MKNISNILLCAFFLLYIESSFAQNEQELWVKISPELRLNIDKTPFEFRWRPVDVIYLPEIYVPSGRIARTDIMLGVTNKHFKLFSYSKFDEFGKRWTGYRFDFNFTLFDKKLLVNLQQRYFWGLNENSTDHHYLVHYTRMKLISNTLVGILGYGNFKTGKAFNTGNWFIGPSIDYEFWKAFNLHLALTKDIFHTQSNMLYVRLGYKIKLNVSETGE